MFACQNGHKDVVKLLLENSDIEVNVIGNEGWTVSMIACSEGHKDIVRLLLDNSEMNINLNARDTLGRTTFMIACRKGRKGVVKILVEHSKTKGIDILTGQDQLSEKMRAFIENVQF